MITEERAIQLMATSFEKLKESDMVGKNETLTRKTILLGRQSSLDSIGFVTFITGLEEAVGDETKKDLPLVLNEISAFNVDKPELSADDLAKYIVKLSKGN